MKKLLLSFFIASSFFCFSQEVLNQYDDFEDLSVHYLFALVDNSELNIDVINESLNSVEFYIQDKEFVISPNPAKDRLNIILPSGSDNMQLEVFDVLGKRVYKGLLTKLESSINVSNWRSGVYLVRISDNSTSQTKRFIKQ